MPKEKKGRQVGERINPLQAKKEKATAAVRQSITFNKDFGQHILRVSERNFLDVVRTLEIMDHSYDTI